MAGHKLRARLAKEARTAGVVFAYLTLLLGAFTTYRRVILAEYDIDYFRFGYGLLEALILTKMVILGRFLRLGEGFRDRPRIVPTLYKTLCFSLLVMLFAVLESVAADLWHGKSVALALYDLAHGGLAELLAKFIMVVTAFTPLFALWEVGHVLGEGKLFELFFTHPRKADPSCAATPRSLA